MHSGIWREVRIALLQKAALLSVYSAVPTPVKGPIVLMSLGVRMLHRRMSYLSFHLQSLATEVPVVLHFVLDSPENSDVTSTSDDICDLTRNTHGQGPHPVR
jgi:hypothetical protein